MHELRGTRMPGVIRSAARFFIFWKTFLLFFYSAYNYSSLSHPVPLLGALIQGIRYPGYFSQTSSTDFLQAYYFITLGTKFQHESMVEAHSGLITHHQLNTFEEA